MQKIYDIFSAVEYLNNNYCVKRLILSGVSQGAAVALKAVFSEKLLVFQLVLVISAIRDRDHLLSMIPRDCKLFKIPVLILVEEQDIFYSGAIALTEHLEKLSITCKLITYQNLGHLFPSRFY